MANATLHSEDTLQHALDSDLAAFLRENGSDFPEGSYEDPRAGEGDNSPEACEGGGSDCYPSDENQGGLVGDVELLDEVAELLRDDREETLEDDPRAGEGDNSPEACEGGGSDCYPSDENQGG